MSASVLASHVLLQLLFIVMIACCMTSCVAADCGYPGFPAGLTTPSLMHRSYREGSVLTAECKNDLRPVSYRLSCVRGQWLIRSHPPDMPLQSCRKSISPDSVLFASPVVAESCLLINISPLLIFRIFLSSPNASLLTRQHTYTHT